VPRRGTDPTDKALECVLTCTSSRRTLKVAAAGPSSPSSVKAPDSSASCGAVSTAATARWCSFRATHTPR
jgi:hypothetical protein